MNTSDIETVYNNVREHLEKSWMNRPEEIRQLEGRKGAWGCTLAVHLFCFEEAREIVELVWAVRDALKAGRLSLEAAASFLGHALIERGLRLSRSYKIKELPDILNQVGSVLSKTSSEAEFIRVVDQLLLYAGRYNYWLDADLDWKTLSETHEKLREKHG